MVDYSKFDNIEDSDEEREKSAVTRQAAKPWEAPFQPPARCEPSRSNVKSESGRELLEPAGLDKKLNFGFQGGDVDALQEQMARYMAMNGQVPPGALGSAPQEPEQAKPRKPNEPQRTCVRSDGRKKVHTTHPDGSELVEEYDEKTDVLLLRKSRKSTTFGGEAEWTIEVGQVQEAAFDPHSHVLRASSSNPIFLRKDTPEHFQWRIRNLLYPADVYSVTIDDEKQQIVVRTSNKKYFKRIDVPDLSRLNLKLAETSLSWKHQHNTLIISYTRPIEVIKAEQESLKLVAKTAVNI